MRKYDPRLSVIQDTEFRRRVIFTVSDIFEERGPAIYDESVLPNGKDVTLFAYLYEVATNPDVEEVEVFAAGALLLGNFQLGVGRKPLMPTTIHSGVNELNEIRSSEKSLPRASKAAAKFLDMQKKALEDRFAIRERVQRAKFYNTGIQSLYVRMTRRLWKPMRGLLFITLTSLLMFASLPTLILPSALRKSLMGKIPTKWLNDLDEYPDYQLAVMWPHARDIL